MHVELHPHKGINVVTKKEQCFEQYKVLSGHPDKLSWVGVIGWKEDSKLIFFRPLDPITEEKIRDQVSLQLKREADFVSCPEIDEDLLHPPTESQLDEFNESDLT
ncbi:MAG: hypothetical protein ACR2NF_07655 [Pirellulales bacterium]